MKLNILSMALISAMFAGNLAAQSLSQQQAEVDAARAVMAERSAEVDSARAQQAAAEAEIMAAHAGHIGRRERAPLSDRDELAMAALEGLMSSPDTRVLPILKKVLNGTHSDVVKARALFVLSQIGLDEAQQMLLDYVRNSKGELQQEAVRSVGIGGNAKSLEALLPLLPGADARLRSQVLEAFMIANRKDLVMKLALAAKSESEAREAIHMLSALGAIDELRQLGAQGKYTGSLIEAYAIAGDLQSLLKIAEGPGDARQRKDAIRQIGIVSSKEARQALRDIYVKAKEPELKSAALEGMLISSDQQGVLALYRASTDLKEKRTLLRTLSVMGGDAALEAIDAALEGNAP